MNYTCPVCGYNRLDLPPSDFNICPSCGTEFGYDDFEYSIGKLTNRWIGSGMQWWSDSIPAPEGWNPYVQLQRISFQIYLTSVTETTRDIALPGNVVPNITGGRFSLPGRQVPLPVRFVSNSSSNYAFATR